MCRRQLVPDTVVGPDQLERDVDQVVERTVGVQVAAAGRVELLAVLDAVGPGDAGVANVDDMRADRAVADVEAIARVEHVERGAQKHERDEAGDKHPGTGEGDEWPGMQGPAANDLDHAHQQVEQWRIHQRDRRGGVPVVEERERDAERKDRQQVDVEQP